MKNPFNGIEVNGVTFIGLLWGEKQIYLDNLDQVSIDAIWSIIRKCNKSQVKEVFESKESVDGSALVKILKENYHEALIKSKRS